MMLMSKHSGNSYLIRMQDYNGLIFHSFGHSSVIVGIVVKFELYELYFWLELYEL